MESKRIQFINGLKDGLPIALGYLPVSFSFGMLAAAGGLPPFLAVLLSMTNLTSAGQFAGMNIIISGGTYIELAVSMLVINIRYMLMSLALSQKIEKMPLIKRMIISYGITDEIFAVAAMKPRKISFAYSMGLIIGPYIGWSLGTVLGAFISDLLPEFLASSMGITLYAMFIAIIIPASKAKKSVLAVTVFAAAVSAVLYYLPFTASLSGGWTVIIASVAASLFGAVVFPDIKEGNER